MPEDIREAISWRMLEKAPTLRPASSPNGNGSKAHYTMSGRIGWAASIPVICRAATISTWQETASPGDLRPSRQNSGGCSYWVEDRHLNIAGNKFVADELTRYVRLRLDEDEKSPRPHAEE